VGAGLARQRGQRAGLRQRHAADDVAALYAGATSPWGSLDGFRDALPASLAALDDSEALSAELYSATLPGRQFAWQSGWTTFYRAWWIAFSPFVGLFLARISKGRTVREFVFGCVIAPALVCFLWMTILGGTAIDLELSGVAEGAIIGATNTAKLFVTLGQMIDGPLLSGITIMCVVLIMTFLVTSADSGILVMNTIMSGGEQETGVKHRIIWGLILTAVIGTLILAGASGADADPFATLQNAMIIGALPFAIAPIRRTRASATTRSKCRRAGLPGKASRTVSHPLRGTGGHRRGSARQARRRCSATRRCGATSSAIARYRSG